MLNFRWLDLALFRDYPEAAPCFKLVPPAGFNDSFVAINLLSEITESTAKNIIYKNRVAVEGGVIFGLRSLLMDFIGQFRKGVTA